LLNNIKNKKFAGKKIFLKKLTKRNCNEIYLSWLKDKNINQYLEARWKSYNKKKLKEFVNTCNKSKNNILFGIFKDTNEHIGNIKIDINWHHGFCYLGYFLGHIRSHGKSYGSDAIRICCYIAFKLLNMRMCFAGVYSNNIPGIRVLEKNGFKKVSTIKKMYKIKGKLYSDELTYCLEKNNFKKN
jgi:RimJ/RimL family protein N-acetyltransferase